jgi:hypothetical protein
MCLALVVVAGALVFPDQALSAHSATGSSTATILTPTVATDLPHFGWGQDDESGPLVDAGTLSRWLTYLAIMLMIGAAVFGPITRRAFAGPDARSDVAALCQRTGLRWGLVGSLVFLLAATGRLYAQVLAFLFPGDPLTMADVGTILFDTNWGARWLIQFGAGLVAAVGFFLARRGVRAGGSIAVIGAIATGVTLPLT